MTFFCFYLLLLSCGNRELNRLSQPLLVLFTSTEKKKPTKAVAKKITRNLDLNLRARTMRILEVLFLFYLRLAVATPPACFLSCINEMSYYCGNGHMDFSSLCAREETLIQCLVDICPYGTFLSARDHFLGTCMEHGKPSVTNPYPPPSLFGNSMQQLNQRQPNHMEINANDGDRQAKNAQSYNEHDTAFQANIQRSGSRSNQHNYPKYNNDIQDNNNRENINLQYNNDVENNNNRDTNSQDINNRDTNSQDINNRDTDSQNIKDTHNLQNLHDTLNLQDNNHPHTYQYQDSRYEPHELNLQGSHKSESLSDIKYPPLVSEYDENQVYPSADSSSSKRLNVGSYPYAQAIDFEQSNPPVRRQRDHVGSVRPSRNKYGGG